MKHLPGGRPADTGVRPGRSRLLAACTVLLATPAQSQETAPADAPLTVPELEAALRQRDAVILQLLERVENLERRLGVTREQPSAEAGPPASPPPEPPEAVSSAPAGPQDAGADAESETPGTAPGQFKVDEEAVERALERTLVRTGALLLPAGRAEIEPSFSYTRRVDDHLSFIQAAGDDIPAILERRRNEFDFSLGLRVGLPFDSQLELNLPYTVVDESIVVGGFESENTGTGFGDFSVGIAKTLLREERWWPDVVARVGWDTGSGPLRDESVALGGGFHQILGQLSATKRQDPLAFVASAGYRGSLEEDDLDPGDELLFNLGVVLAASPETSLRLTLSQQFAQEAESAGRSLPGTDQVASTLSVGASSILGSGVFLDGSVSIGLTDDAPDYAFILSLPVRFGLPWF